jgi:hypothetical protein
MRQIQTLRDIEELFQAGFENDEDTLEQFGKIQATQLKAYLIESNRSLDQIGCPLGAWRHQDSDNWYANSETYTPNTLFLDTSRGRVWVLYSLLDATKSEEIVNGWIKNTQGLDKCWLSRNHLLHWAKMDGWIERGLGLRFSDSLSPEETASNLSFKAWYGANPRIQSLYSLLDKAKEDFAIYSVRWQRRSKASVTMSTEWYSDGKVTVNKATDVDEVLLWISEMADKYLESLATATNLRNSTVGAFEIDFSQDINLDAFANIATKGKGNMNLWLVETEKSSDFRRFKGIDLHTWDRILLDLGPNYAYLTIPAHGCVNAAPRLAVTQGEDNGGKASIYHDGVEVFA